MNTTLNRIYPAEFVYSSVFVKGNTGSDMTATSPETTTTRQRRKQHHQDEPEDGEVTNNNRFGRRSQDDEEEAAEPETEATRSTYSSYKDNESFDGETNAVDPFTHHLELSNCQKLGLFIGAITIAPIRIVLYLLLALLATLLSAIGQIGLKEEELKAKLLTGWRGWMQQAVIVMIDLSLVLMGFHRVGVSGQVASAKEAPLLVCAPHSSIGDIIPMMLTRSRPVAKAGIAPLISQFMQVMIVNRSSKDSRKQVLEDLKRRVEETQEGRWPHTIIFPEGTCTNAQALVKFKIGAFYPGLPVQPVLLRPRCVLVGDDDNRKYKKTGIDTLTWTWNQNFNFYWCFFLTACQLNNDFHVEFLPVYRPSEAERADPELFASNVRAQMASKLNLPIVDVSFSSYLNNAGNNKRQCAAQS